MPIYEYRCTTCGFEKDFLQKVSDPILTDCPECGKATFEKQLTAAGFQLKGNGWYATDFKNNGTKPPVDKNKPSSAAVAEGTSESDNSGSGSEKSESSSDKTASTSEKSESSSDKNGSDKGAKDKPAETKKAEKSAST